MAFSRRFVEIGGCEIPGERTRKNENNNNKKKTFLVLLIDVGPFMSEKYVKYRR